MDRSTTTGVGWGYPSIIVGRPRPCAPVPPGAGWDLPSLTISRESWGARDRPVDAGAAPRRARPGGGRVRPASRARHAGLRDVRPATGGPAGRGRGSSWSDRPPVLLHAHLHHGIVRSGRPPADAHAAHRAGRGEPGQAGRAGADRRRRGGGSLQPRGGKRRGRSDPPPPPPPPPKPPPRGPTDPLPRRAAAP